MKHDTKLHLIGGAAVLLAATALACAWLAMGLHALTALLLMAGVMAGAAVEGTQWHDNRNARRAGLPLPHEVSLRDFWNSAVPCVLGAAVAEALARQGLLPWPF